MVAFEIMSFFKGPLHGLFLLHPRKAFDEQNPKLILFFYLTIFCPPPHDS